MRNRLGLIVAVAGGVVAIIVVVSLVGQVRVSPPEETVEPGPQPKESVGQPQELQIEGTEVTQRDEQGNIIWQVRAAGQLNYDESSQTLQGEDIHWELMRAGREKLIVEAPRFAAQDKNQQINFSDGVQVYTESKSQIFAVSSLTYESDTQKLIGHGSVRFRVGNWEATGRRLVIDNRRQEVRLAGPGHFSRLSG